VLTLFERLNFKQLPFYLDASAILHSVIFRAGAAGKPRWQLDVRTQGQTMCNVSRINVAGSSSRRGAMRHIGTLLARMHTPDRTSRIPAQPARLGWWKSTVPQLQGFLDDATFDLLAEEVIHQDTFQRTPDFESLPQGPVHADLFRDNVLWDGDAVGGVIDFYFAGARFGCSTLP